MASSLRRPDRLPDLLIVGAHKAATTSLHHYLGEHPQVFMSPLKETRFFVADYFRRLAPDYPRREALLRRVLFTEEEYAAQFAAAGPAMVAGEASPQYLYLHDLAIPRIRALLGDPAIVMVLREPVSRAYSAYRLLRRDGVTDDSFETVLAREPWYVAQVYPPYFHLTAMGFYTEAVRAYRRHFTRVRVLLYDDLQRDPAGVLAALFAWLNVDPGFVPDLTVWHNAGEATPPDPDPATRCRLRALYRPDILALEQELGLDLASWHA